MQQIHNERDTTNTVRFVWVDRLDRGWAIIKYCCTDRKVTWDAEEKAHVRTKPLSTLVTALFREIVC